MKRFTPDQIVAKLRQTDVELGKGLASRGSTGGSRSALPHGVKHWLLTTLREKLIKIGCKVVHHARRVVFQLAEVAIPRGLFRAILERIRRLRSPQAVPK